MPSVQKVMLVGHCGFDAGALAQTVRDALGDVEIGHADRQADVEAAGPDTLLLVNRVLDGSFSSGDGVELIRDLASRDHAPRTMLISNFADAQRQAEDVGARPGFGKAEARDAGTHQLLRDAVA